ncbi:MAG: GIY-YIG nuclease family protein [Ignavibacterium sp.]
MYTVYVIYSSSFNKIYIGQTEDIERRMIEHNNGLLSAYKIVLTFIFIRLYYRKLICHTYCRILYQGIFYTL